MLNFFKNKNTIEEEEITFLKTIISKLPSKYSYLPDQVNKEFILGKKVNDLGENGSYTLVLNAQLEKKYSNKNLPQFFILKGLKVWNKVREDYEEIEFDILEGMLAGFKNPSNYKNLDSSKMDLSEIKEKHFKNQDEEALIQILGKADQKLVEQFDINGTLKIELPEGLFYTIKDLKDGNYLAVNEKGEIYALIHDPYLVKKLYNSLEVLMDQVKAKKFIFNVDFILSLIQNKNSSGFLTK